MTVVAEELHAQKAAAADPHSRSHRTGSAPALIAPSLRNRSHSRNRSEWDRFMRARGGQALAKAPRADVGMRL
jgi:hypothetical protein